MTVLTSLSKYRFAAHKCLHDHYLCVSLCAISSLLQMWSHIFNICNWFFISTIYLAIYIQAMCFTFIDNASPYSESFNYTTYMHRSQRWDASPPFVFPISSISHFSFSLKCSNLCCLVLMFSFKLRLKGRYIDLTGDSLCAADKSDSLESHVAKRARSLQSLFHIVAEKSVSPNKSSALKINK